MPAAGGPEGQGDEGQVVLSKLTFVDLAGSERLKRTGAEGERRREGIQVSSPSHKNCAATSNACQAFSGAVMLFWA